jgi:micrococcal nuclease
MNWFSILPLFLSFSLNSITESHSFVGKCLAVLDGDTIDVSRNGTTIRVRLEGIDCPEKDQPFAEEAKAFTANLISGKTVSVIEKEKDEYGRTVARVFVDGRDVSVELLKAGLATHYRKYNSDWLLAALEQEAKAARAGIWASLTTLPPVEKPIPIPAWAASETAGKPGEIYKITYHGNVNSRVFHAPSCRNYNCKNCTRILRSKEEAIAGGFRPCGQCRP